MNGTSTCIYCSNEIRPMDQHAKAVKASVVHGQDGKPIQIQEVTCILNRTVIANISPVPKETK